MPIEPEVNGAVESLRRKIARRLDSLPVFLREFLAFGIKQGWACLFGGLMLFLMLGSKFLWQPAWPLARYDFLFFSAIVIQAVFLLARLESWEEAKVILIFHVVGTVMELFKTHMGSWVYPEENLFRIGGVPLFSGFMYACIGSYLARIWRLLDFGFSLYPPLWMTSMLCLFIYLNFFTHHFMPDLRVGLFLAIVLLYGRVSVYFTPYRVRCRMPLLLGFLLVSLFIWFAENIGTFASAWRYPDQREWHMVSLQKLGAWLLLMLVSFVLVSFVHPPRTEGNG